MAKDKTLRSYLPKEARALLPKPPTKKKREPRVSLDQLNAGQVEAFKRAAEEISTPEDKRPGYVKVLDVLDIGGNAARNAIGDVAGVDKSKLQRATFGRPRVTGADILEAAGMKPGAGRAALGLGVDIITDPLFWLGGPAKAATQLVRGAPRILPKGMKAIRAAVKTGKFDAGLAAAAGVRNTARIEKVLQRAAEGTANLKRHADPFKYLTGGQGTIAKGLSKGFAKGSPETLGWLKQFGEKGPALFGIPFTSKAFGTLTPERVTRVLGERVGKKLWKPNEAVSRLLPKTSRMASVQQGLDNPQAWEPLRKALDAAKGGRAAVVAGHAGAAAAKERGAAQTKQAEQAVNAVLEKSGGMSTPKPFKTMVRSEKAKIAKAEKAQAGPGFKSIQTVRNEAAAELKQGRARRLEGENLFNAAKSSPDAPGPVQQIQAIEQGQRAIPGRGVLQTLQRAKRDLFGSGPSLTRTKVAGLEARHARASAKEAATVNLANKRVAPIMAKYAVGGETPEAVRDTLHAIASAGPKGQNLARLPADSPLHAIYDKARAMGMLDDADVQNIVADLWKGGEVNLALAKRLGLPVKRLESYAQPRVVTKEYGDALRQQERVTGNIAAGPRPGGKISTAVPSSVPRGRWNYYQMPDGTVKRAYSENQSARQLEQAGGKLAKTEDLSVQDWNAMSADPTNPLGLKAAGQAREGQEVFKGKLFETDIARSFGAQARQQEQMRFVADTKKMIDQYAVKISNPEQASRPEFANLVKIGTGEIDPNGAFGELAKKGLFDVYLPPEIADAVRRLAAIDRTPQAVGDLIQATDRTLGFWKTLQLMHPSYLLRNVWTNTSVHAVNGGSALKQSAIATDRNWWNLRNAMLAGTEQGIAGKTINLGGQAVPQQQLYRWLLEHNAVGAGRASMMPGSFAGKTGGAATFAAATEKTKGATQAIFKANMAAEDMQRIGAWVDFVDQGLDWESAWQKAMMSMPDLSDLTKFERNTMRRIVPFYAWMRKNGANQLLHFLPQKPYVMAGLPKFKDFAEGLKGDESVPDELRPAWMREGFAAQVTGNAEGGTAFVPMSWTPWDETLAATALPFEPKATFKQGIESLRPVARFAIETATGKNIFRGTDYAENMTVADMARAVPKAIIGQSNTPVDTLLGLRPAREPFRMSQMPSAGAAAARLGIGGALQPVSRQGGLAAEYGNLSDQVRRLRAQIGRAQQANDTALVQSLMVEYAKLQKRMVEMGFPGVPKSTQVMLQRQGVKAGAPAFGQ